MSVEVIILNLNDNVATAARQLEIGESFNIDGNTNITISRRIPVGHKLAISEIASGDSIIKYSEIIGQAMVDIDIGDHVHVHNVEGLRGRGDKQ